MKPYSKLTIEGELSPAERLIAEETIAVVRRLLGDNRTHAATSDSSLLSVVVNGAISPNDLEAVRIPLEKLHNMGCGIAVYDAQNKATLIDFVSGALVYRAPEPETEPAPGLDDAEAARPIDGKLDIFRPEAYPPRRTITLGQAALLCLVVLAAVFLYFKLNHDELRENGENGDGREGAALVRDAGHAAANPGGGGTPRPEGSESGDDEARSSPSHVIEFDGGTKVFAREIDMRHMSGTFKANHERLAAMLRDYRNSHTYSMDDFFVCVDMVNDVCNMIRTRGMDAAMVVGRVDTDMADLSDQEYLSSMNHAWVVAELEPGTWVPVEATDGAIVPPSLPNYDLYTGGVRFHRSADFKRFIELRQRTGEVCRNANEMVATFNERYAGKPEDRESLAQKGAVEQRRVECEELHESVLAPVRRGRW